MSSGLNSFTSNRQLSEGLNNEETIYVKEVTDKLSDYAIIREYSKMQFHIRNLLFIVEVPLGLLKLFCVSFPRYWGSWLLCDKIL